MKVFLAYYHDTVQPRFKPTVAKMVTVAFAQNWTKLTTMGTRIIRSHPNPQLPLHNPRANKHEVLRTHNTRNGSNGKANFTIEKIKKFTLQIARIVRRITKKGPASRRKKLRIMLALVVCRLSYSLPFNFLNRQETEQANTILHTAYKMALGFRNYTATEKLMSLWISNTFEEIRGALLITQKELQKIDKPLPYREQQCTRSLSNPVNP